MKLKDAVKKLGISQKVVDELEESAATLLASDEFNRREPRRLPGEEPGPDYRERAINRAIKAQVPFYSDGNLVYDLVKRYVRILCPYCGVLITGHGGGGTADYMGVDFRCVCGAGAHLCFHDDGISFSPPRASA